MINHLNDEEVSRVRDAVARRRTPETLVDGKWSVSPLNRDPKVLGKPMPAKVRLRDITLRTMEQTPGVWVSPNQRRHLCEQLMIAGVKSVQIAWLAVKQSYDIKGEVELLKSLTPDVETSVFGGTTSQIEVAADAGIDLYTAYAPSIYEFSLIYGPYGRAILRAYRDGEDWRSTVSYPRSEEEHLERLGNDVIRAKELGMRGAMFCSMLHYASLEYVAKFAKVANEVGADEIGFGDGASGLGPEGWREVVRVAREGAPNAVVTTHTHNAFGLGSASTNAGFHAGAHVGEVAVNGLCSASGQADLAEVAASLEVLYGVSTGLDLTKMVPLSRFVEDITGLRVARNKPVTGSEVWTYTEEAIFEEEKFAPVHKAVNPELFGGKAGYKVGRFSGASLQEMLRGKLEENGITVGLEELGSVINELKARMESQGRTLEDQELVDTAIWLLSRRGIVSAV